MQIEGQNVKWSQKCHFDPFREKHNPHTHYVCINLKVKVQSSYIRVICYVLLVGMETFIKTSIKDIN